MASRGFGNSGSQQRLARQRQQAAAGAFMAKRKRDRNEADHAAVEQMLGDPTLVTAGAGVPPIALGVGETLVLGRNEPPPFNLGGDTTLSGQHARVTRFASGEIILEDLGSRNGTVVGGQRVSGMHALHPGDRIEFGAVRCSLQGSAAAPDRLPVPSPGHPVCPLCRSDELKRYRLSRGPFGPHHKCRACGHTF